MAETYCGKSCDICPEQSQLNCPGCRVGPGRAYAGDCTIAKCCLSRNLQSCMVCTASSTCFNRRSSSTASSSRLKKQIDAAAKEQRLFGQCKLLGKWLWVLFWLVISSTVVGLILNDTVLLMVPSLKFPSFIINAVFSVCHALILLKLCSVSDHYRTAGISTLICAALNFLISVLGESGWGIALSLLTLLPSFISIFQEFLGHSDATEELDPNMAEKWRKLWYWTFGSTCAVVIGTLLALIGLVLGVLIVLLASICTIVVAVIKIIYLYSTAKAFREYVAESPKNV